MRQIATTLQLLPRRRRWQFAALALVSVATAVVELLAAGAIAAVLSLVLQGEIPASGLRALRSIGLEDAPSTLLALSAAFAALLTRALLFLFQQFLVSRVSEAAGADMAEWLFATYLRRPLEWHRGRHTSELVRNTWSSVAEVQSSVLQPLAILVAEGVVILALVGAAVVVSPVAALAVGAGLFLVVVVVLRALQQRLRDTGHDAQIMSADAFRAMEEGFGGIRDIILTESQQVPEASFRTPRRAIAALRARRALLLNLPRTSVEIAFFALLLSAAMFGGSDPDSSDSTTAALGAAAYLGLRLQPAVQKVAAALAGLRHAETAFEIVTELRDTGNTTTTRAPNPAIPTEPTSFVSLELEQGTYRYPGTKDPVFVGLDLMVTVGEWIGVTGPTGIGKSTLLDVISGLVPLERGRLLLDSRPVEDVRLLRRHVAMVEQRGFVIDASVRQNVAFVSGRSSDDDVLASLETAGLADTVTSFPGGLDAPVGQDGARLSGGQRQRLLLARAIHRRPGLLLLDEATSALDMETERLVLERLRNSFSGAVVMVAHRPAPIAMCDRSIRIGHPAPGDDG